MNAELETLTGARLGLKLRVCDVLGRIEVARARPDFAPLVLEELRHAVPVRGWPLYEGDADALQARLEEIEDTFLPAEKQRLSDSRRPGGVSGKGLHWSMTFLDSDQKRACKNAIAVYREAAELLRNWLTLHAEALERGELPKPTPGRVNGSYLPAVLPEMLAAELERRGIR